MQLNEFFQKWARGRGVTVGHEVAVEVRRLLSVQAPTRRTRFGRLVATARAKPFAPPRMVTRRLRNSVREIPTKHGMKLVVYAPYAAPLEKSHRWRGWPHRFLSVALESVGTRGRNSLFRTLFMKAASFFTRR